MDRKLDLLVGELQRYNVSVGGIQETKWFGADVWPAANGYTLLHSGRPVPSSDDAVTRREGVGLESYCCLEDGGSSMETS